MFTYISWAVALLGAILYYFFVRPLNYWKKLGVKQGELLPLLEVNWGPLRRTRSNAENVQFIYNMFPGTRYTGMYQLNKPTLMIKDPNLLKQLVIKDFGHFMDRIPVVSMGDEPIISKNLLDINGQDWRNMRPTLSHGFTGSKMRGMYSMLTKCAENFVNYYLEKNQDFIEVEMKDAFGRHNVDVVASTSFGIEIDSLAHPKNDFYIMSKNATDFNTFWIVIYRLFRINVLGKNVTDFVYSLVKDIIKTRDERKIVRPDLFHFSLQEARKGKTETELANGDPIEDISAQAMMFYFAGFESTSTTMSFMAYELAINKDVQDRLREEIVETLEACGNKLTYEALLNMKYMDMVVTETLRLWPNIPQMDRVCTEPYTIEPATPDEKPLRIEKGVVIWLPFYAIQRDPKHYPNPEKFDPERFSDENKNNVDPYTYLPFGIGPRHCMGSRFALLQIKLVMFHILANFELEPIERTNVPVTLKKSLNIYPVGGFWLGMRRIKK